MQAIPNDNERKGERSYLHDCALSPITFCAGLALGATGGSYVYPTGFFELGMKKSADMPIVLGAGVLGIATGYLAGFTSMVLPIIRDSSDWRNYIGAGIAVVAGTLRGVYLFGRKSKDEGLEFRLQTSEKAHA